MKKIRTADDEGFTTKVFDSGRRGEPLPGCDCVTCFGYCMINREAERYDILRFMEDVAKREFT